MSFNKTSAIAGMKVWLKSGGPTMTAKKPSPDGWVCSWFAGDEVKEHTFVAEQLTDEDPNPKKKVTGIKVV